MSFAPGWLGVVFAVGSPRGSIPFLCGRAGRSACIERVTVLLQADVVS